MPTRLTLPSVFALFLIICSAWASAQPQIDAFGGIPVGQGGLYDPRFGVPANERLPSVNLQLAGGEYESGTFAVRAAAGDLQGVAIDISDLINGSHVIASADVDVRTIKWWYQARKRDPIAKQFVPELLLHDDSVVLSSNHAAETNTLKYDMNTIHDTAALQAVDVANSTLKQYWMTVHASPGMAPGIYTGTATVSAQNAASKVIPISVTVRPFDLQETPQIFSVYDQINIGSLDEAPILPLGGTGLGEGASVNGNNVSVGQFKKDLTLMGQYGIKDPAHYSDPLNKVIPLRQVFGPPVAGKPYFSVYGQTNWADEEIIRVRDAALAAGATDVYIAAGIDEPFQVSQFIALQQQIQNAHNLGVKVFGAMEGSVQGNIAFDYLGGLIDAPALKLNGNQADIDKWKAVSEMVLGNSYPQAFEESFVAVRQSYGLTAWARGLDGIMAYCFQTSYGGGNVWDDFDSGGIGSPLNGWDMNMVYKVASGDPVPTLQLAGYREAYDDMRYLATLMRWMDLAAADHPGADEVLDAASFLESLQLTMASAYGLDPVPNVDLTGWRNEMADHIVALQQLVVPEPTFAGLLLLSYAALIRRVHRR